jgi:tetratricopeptide (TPR) repeat protein
MRLGRSWRLWALALVTFLIAALLGISSNVASVLVPKDWTEQHSALVWTAVGLLVVASAVAFVAGLRHQNAIEGSRDSSVHAGDVGRDLVVVRKGGIVNIGAPIATPPPTGTSEQIVVGELPGRPPSFVERSAVKRLEDIFAGGQTIATVTALTGSRGTGKTQVAAQFARQAIDKGVPLVAWISAEDQGRLLAGLAEIAERVGVADADGDSERSARQLRDALATRAEHAVVVFDNATDPEALRHYLPATGPTQLVITSTDQAFALMGGSVPVDTFDRTQSVAYLAERTGLTDEKGADSVAECLGDLPLALAQAATVIKLQQLTYKIYLERLQALSLDEMLPPDRGDAYPRGTGSAILLSVQAVDDDDRDGLTKSVLAACSLLDASGMSRAVLPALVIAPSDHILDETLARLVEASLMVWADDRRAVVMHRLIARVIRDRLQAEGQLEELIVSVAERLHDSVPDIEGPTAQSTSNTEFVSHAIALWKNAINDVQPNALTKQQIEVVANLVNRVVYRLIATAAYSRAIDVGKSIANYCEPTFGSDSPVTLVLHNNLASAYLFAGRTEEAISLYERTLPTRERVLGREHRSTLISRNNLGWAYRLSGRTDDAIPILEETLATRTRALGDDHTDTLGTRNNLASAYMAAGRIEEAIALHKQTLTAAERVLDPDHPYAITSRGNLAGAYLVSGRQAEAIVLYEKTVAGSERALGRYHADTLTWRIHLGQAYLTGGRTADAIRFVEESLAGLEHILGDDHPTTLGAREILADARRAQRDDTQTRSRRR